MSAETTLVNIDVHLSRRNVKESEDVINRAMQSLKDKGFINYFGLFLAQICTHTRRF